MKVSISQKIYVGFGLALLMLSVIGIASYRSLTELVDSARWVTHTHAVLKALGDLSSHVKDAETGQRGYIITGEEGYLDPYRAAEKAIYQKIADLRGLISDNPGQLRRLETLAPLIERRLPLIRETIALRRDRGFETASRVVLTGEGMKVMDGIRKAVREMEDEENRLLKQRSEREKASAQSTIFTISLGSLLAFVFVGSAIFFIRRDVASRIRAEETLRESETRIRAVLDNVMEGIITIDERGVIESINPSAESLFGYPAGEIVGQKVNVLMPEPYRGEHDGYIQRYLLTGEARVIGRGREVVGQRRDGTTFPIELSVSEFFLGSRRMFTGIARDIAERKRAEKSREEQARIAAFGAEVGVALTQNDTLRNTLQRCAGAAVRHLDAAFARIWTLNDAGDVLELQASAGMYTHIDGPHGRVPVGKFKIGLIAAERKPHLTNAVVGDPRVGDQEWARREGMAAFAGYPLIIEGRLMGVMAMFARRPLDEVILQALASVADIIAVGIERHRSGEALRESEEKYRDLFENASDLIQSIAPDGGIVYANRAWRETLGYDLEDIASLTMSDIIHPDCQSHCAELFRRVMSGEDVGRIETAFITRGGEKIEVEGSANCKLAEGRPIATRGIFRDITERKRVERLKNEFISVVSHELRTPLTSIRGSLGLLAGGVAGQLPPQARSLLDIAVNNSDRLVRLINDILDIEKIESGKMDFKMKPLDLVTLVEQAIEANRAYGERFNVRFALESSLPEARVEADGDRLMQVLTNLLSNAAKFSPPGEAVTVSVERRGGDIRVSVTDRGPGIPEEFWDRMFQRFAQADSSDTRQKGGTGLGLSISKAIVERHGGQIGFETEVGRGTAFYFDLPEHRVELPATAPEGEVQPHRPRILICEDDRDVANLLSMMLDRGRFICDLAYSAAQARQLLEQNPYDAMTLDIMLPDQDGISFLRELRAQERTRHLPIVVVSAKTLEGQKELNGEAFAVIDWIEKPIDEARLEEAIKQAVSCAADRRPRILHVEDDLDIVRVVSALLRDVADVVCAANLREARGRLEQETFDLVILDLALPDGSGLELVPLLSRKIPPVPVVVFSATEVGRETAQQINAALVKSTTSNQELLETIRSLIRPGSAA